MNFNNTYKEADLSFKALTDEMNGISHANKVIDENPNNFKTYDKNYNQDGTDAGKMRGFTDHENGIIGINVNKDINKTNGDYVEVTAHEYGHLKGLNEQSATRLGELIRGFDSDYNGNSNYGFEKHDTAGKVNNEVTKADDGYIKGVREDGVDPLLNKQALDGNSRITSEFQPARVHPKTGVITKHQGTDIINGENDNKTIHVTADGEVVKIGHDVKEVYNTKGEKTTKGYGNYIVVDHGNGTKTIYAHLKDASMQVKEGQRVYEGQDVAEMGETGGATATHLHYEILKQNPKTNKYEAIDSGNDKPGTTATEFINVGKNDNLKDTPWQKAGQSMSYNPIIQESSILQYSSRLSSGDNNLKIFK